MHGPRDPLGKPPSSWQAGVPCCTASRNGLSGGNKFHACVRLRIAANAKIRFLRANSIDHIECVAIVHCYGDPGMACSEGVHERAYELNGNGRKAGYDDPTVPFLVQTPNVDNGGAEIVEESFRNRQEATALVCQANPARGAVQQTYAQRALQESDICRNGGCERPITRDALV